MIRKSKSTLPKGRALLLYPRINLFALYYVRLNCSGNFINRHSLEHNFSGTGDNSIHKTFSTEELAVLLNTGSRKLAQLFRVLRKNDVAYILGVAGGRAETACFKDCFQHSLINRLLFELADGAAGLNGVEHGGAVNAEALTHAFHIVFTVLVAHKAYSLGGADGDTVAAHKAALYHLCFAGLKAYCLAQTVPGAESATYAFFFINMYHIIFSHI